LLWVKLPTFCGGSNNAYGKIDVFFEGLFSFGLGVLLSTDVTMANYHFSPPFGIIFLELFPSIEQANQSFWRIDRPRPPENQGVA